MQKLLTMTLALGASGLVSAADLPERRVESVNAARAESSAPAVAVAPAPAAAAKTSPRPGSAGHWLELQASGRMASPVIQGQTAAEQELANQRFLDSYENPTSQSSPATSASGSTGGSQ